MKERKGNDSLPILSSAYLEGMMNETSWWSTHGPFKPWRECPTRPDPGAVLLFYLEKRGILPDEYMSFLSDLLDLQKSMVYNILKGEGLDSISRCRILVDALKIYPPLLGIDAQYYPIDRHTYWWQTCGYSFDADAQGYPLIGQVIAYFRVHRLSTGGESVKAWSQEDLGDATGLKKETIYRMEHDRNPLVLEHMSRRTIVATTLGTVAGDQESTLFHLFGLDPQAYGVPVPTQDPIPEVLFLPECLTEELLQEYQQKLEQFSTEYSTGHAHHLVEEAHACLGQLQALHLKAETCAQRVSLFALQCRFHGFLAGIAREQLKIADMTTHTDMAVKQAEQVVSLQKRQVCDQAFIVLTHELLAAALLWRAAAYSDYEEWIPAQTEIDQALHLLPSVQNSQLKVHIVAQAGLIHAYAARNEVDRALVLSYFNLAAQLNTPNQLLLAFAAPSDHFIHADTGLLHLYKAMALSAPNMKGTTGDCVLDLLAAAQKWTPPEMIRQRLLIQLFQAHAHAIEGDYREAVETALDALEKSRQIHSRLNQLRLEEFSEQLLDTDCRGQPYLAYLRMKLRTWDYSLD